MGRDCTAIGPRMSERQGKERKEKKDRKKETNTHRIHPWVHLQRAGDEKSGRAGGGGTRKQEESLAATPGTDTHTGRAGGSTHAIPAAAAAARAGTGAQGENSTPKSGAEALGSGRQAAAAQLTGRATPSTRGVCGGGGEAANTPFQDPRAAEGRTGEGRPHPSLAVPMGGFPGSLTRCGSMSVSCGCGGRASESHTGRAPHSTGRAPPHMH